MTIYHVRLHRDVLLTFHEIEAGSPQDAVAIARELPAGVADRIDDNEDLSARVDVADGDEPPVTIDFKAERRRKAAPALLAALDTIKNDCEGWLDETIELPPNELLMGFIAFVTAAIAEAKAAGIAMSPTDSVLLTTLESVLPYAESEAYSLEKLKDSPEAEAEAEQAWKAVETAQAAIAEAKATGLAPAPDEIDLQVLLASRRQIAIAWDTEDVKQVRPDLSDDQAWEVLQQARQEHDAGIGIDWDVLTCHAEMLFGNAPDTDGAEEA